MMKMIDSPVLVKIKGPHILVRIENIEEKSRGGIVIARDEKDIRGKTSSIMDARQIGIVEDIGDECWKEYGEKLPERASIGDKIFFKKYEGIEHRYKDCPTLYRIILWTDIIATIPEGCEVADIATY